MKAARLQDVISDLRQIERGALLDVSCGYGDVLRAGEALGFGPCRGTEIIDSLCDGRRVIKAWAHDLPFAANSFDVVTMLDVIEHLIPGDDMLACRELARVARRQVIVTANMHPSTKHIGEELHINKRAYDEWDMLFAEWFAPAKITWLRKGRRDKGPHASAAWRIDL
jgi:ubiquinone/menaquinone biosynthesis C-methylase UbiE